MKTSSFQITNKNQPVKLDFFWHRTNQLSDFARLSEQRGTSLFLGGTTFSRSSWWNLVLFFLSARILSDHEQLDVEEHEHVEKHVSCKISTWHLKRFPHLNAGGRADSNEIMSDLSSKNGWARKKHQGDVTNSRFCSAWFCKCHNLMRLDPQSLGIRWNICLKMFKWIH